MAEQIISGGCHCRNITWKSTIGPIHLDYCYCRTCQLLSGAPFMAWTGIPKSALTWHIDTPSQTFTYRTDVGDTGKSISERLCCGRCGCNMRIQYDLYPDKAHVAAITAERNDFEWPSVGCHIWTKHRPSWHTIPEDGVTKYQEFDASFQARMDQFLAHMASQQ